MRKTFLAISLCAFLIGTGQAQILTSTVLWEKMADLDKRSDLGGPKKLQMLYDLKKKADSSDLPADSALAKLLHKIGALEYGLNRNYTIAIGFTQKAVDINSSGKKGASPLLAATDFYNLAYFYDNLGLFSLSLPLYDSAIQMAERGPDINDVIPDSKVQKTAIYFRSGDYQKAVQESDLGIEEALKKRDSLHYLAFLNQRAQSLFFLNQPTRSLADVKMAIQLAGSLKQSFNLATAYKTAGFIYAQKKDYPLSEASFRRSIAERVKSKFFGQVAGDYNDLGIIFRDSLRDHKKAVACFNNGIEYAQKEGDSVRLARISINQGETFYLNGQPDKAVTYYFQATRYLKISADEHFNETPAAARLLAVGNNQLLNFLYSSLTESLLALYKKTTDRRWLQRCIRHARLNDTLITRMRHEQLGEESKLYWRESTRGFFRDALEASYLAQDPEQAFYFMEKSRSVLLQDKLNELGASASLPPGEAARQDSFRISIIECQQKLSSQNEASSGYGESYYNLSRAKANLEQYIQSLEKKYPAYYQYKYADDVPSLSELQQWLAHSNQSFVDFFINDSSSLALFVTPQASSLQKIARTGLDPEPYMIRFGRMCSDENYLNQAYPEFIRYSNRLYQIMLGPFRIPEGRVVICQDNYLIPFEALSSDSSREHFLLEDYSFSYVYSARYLLSPSNPAMGKGNFLGIAPVEFLTGQGLASLSKSPGALIQCSNYYAHTKLLIQQEASHSRFMQEVPKYNVVTVLTHANADSSEQEPLLFMYDSPVRLSELQLLEKPVTKLILLSACMTNVGKNFSGEGIFSLARGFSAAGIPAVAATLWQADEQTIYSISEKFNEYISAGMYKDEALRKAKLFYINQNRHKNSLPVYWATMILIGNTEPVKLAPAASNAWGIIAGLLGLGLLVWVFGFRKRRKRTVG
jgi:CHAT domain